MRAPIGVASGGEAPPIVHEVIGTAGQPLGPGVRSFFEPRFGHDFSNVRVHTGQKAGESARLVNANAYTVGSHVVFAAGCNQFDRQNGLHLLAHELSHVVQQTAAGTPVLARMPQNGDLDAKVSLGTLDTPMVEKFASEVLGDAQWVILREFLRGLTGGLLSAPKELKARVEAKFADFGVTDALKYVGGLALGILEGIEISLDGIVEAVITLLKLPSEIESFLIFRAPALYIQYGPRIAKFLTEGEPLTARLARIVNAFLTDPAGSLRQLDALFLAIREMALARVRALGHGAADKILDFLAEPWFQYGRDIGKVVGQILFEVVLAIASDTIGNLVKEALAVVGRLAARVTVGIVDALRSIGRLFGEALRWLEGIGRRLGAELGEVFEGLKALLGRLRALFEELAGEGALADTGTGVRLPVPEARGPAVLESRMARPPAGPSPAELTPPKVHPSNVGKPQRPALGEAPFDEPLTPSELEFERELGRKLTAEELRRKHILEEQAGKQTQFRGETKQEAATGQGRREARTPGRSIPTEFERGEFAHKYAELLISEDKLPRGLKAEVSVELPGGKVRLDRVDFEKGVYYEIKPDTPGPIAAGGDQIKRYAEYMNLNFPLPDGRLWSGAVVTYEKIKAIALFGL